MMDNDKYNKWCDANRLLIEAHLEKEGLSWLDGYCQEFDVTKGSPTNLEFGNWTQLGIATNTKDRDQANYIATQGNTNGTPWLTIRFNCFEGGGLQGAKYVFNSGALKLVSQLYKSGQITENSDEKAAREAALLARQASNEKKRVKREIEEQRKRDTALTELKGFSQLNTDGDSDYLNIKKIGNEESRDYVRHGVDYNGRKYAAIQLVNAETLQPQTLQKFYDNKKIFLPVLPVQQACHILGDMTRSTLTFVFCTGLADSIVLRRAFPDYVVVDCINDNNIGNVVSTFNKKYPDSDKIIVCDNDRFKYDHADNSGILKGVEAARAHGCRYAIPQFPKNSKGKDVWDLEQEVGLDAVKGIIEKAMGADKIENYPQFCFNYIGLEKNGDPLKRLKNAVLSIIEARHCYPLSFDYFVTILWDINTLIENQNRRFSDHPNYKEADLKLYTAALIKERINKSFLLKEAISSLTSFEPVLPSFFVKEVTIERDKRQADIAKIARADLEKFPLISDFESEKENPFLKRVGLPPLALHKSADWKGNECLIVPIYGINKTGTIEESEIIGYQRIYNDGRKRYLESFDVTNSFLILGSLSQATECARLIVEWEDAVTVFGADPDIPVVICFENANLEHVARKIKEQYPNVTIWGCANRDNAFSDVKKGNYDAMSDAIKATKGFFTVPNFEDFVCAGVVGGKGQIVPKSYNHLYCLGGIGPEGLALVKEQLENGVKIPGITAEPLTFHSPTKAMELLKNEYTDFFENDYHLNPSRIIRASSGTGKTTTFCVECAKQCKRNPDLRGAFYLPNNDHAADVTKNLINLGVDAIHIQGRKNLCAKNEAAEQLAKVGGGNLVFSKMCKDKEGNECEHFQSCQWVQQFAQPHQISVFPHAYLPLPHNKLERQLYQKTGDEVSQNARPDFIFIDEDPTSQALKSSRCSRVEFKESSIPNKPLPIKRVILDSLEYGKPLLANLRQAGITPDDLRQVIKDLPNTYPSLKDIKPGLSQAIVLYKLRQKQTGVNVKRPLRLILEELENTEHEHCSKRVSYANETIHSEWLEEFTRHKLPKTRSLLGDTPEQYIPILLSDATADPELISKVLGLPHVIPCIDIRVDRNAHIVQLQTAAVSKLSLAINSNYLEDAFKIADQKAQEGKKVLIVGSEQIVGNTEKGIPPKGPLKVLTESPEHFSFGHFNKIRATNRFEDCDVVIVIGRLQLPAYAIDKMAAAFFWADEKPLLEGTARVPMAYNMRIGVTEWAETWQMMDERSQKIQRQKGPVETEQAIDRIRLIHNRCSKEVFVLSNVPTKLLIDELVTTRELRGTKAPQNKYENLFERFFLTQNAPMVMPLGHTILHKHVSDLFSSQDVLKTWLKRNNLIENLSATTRLDPQVVSYRVEGQRGKSCRAIVLKLMNEESAIQEALSQLHGGKKIKLEGVVTETGILPVFLKDFWDSAIEKGGEVLETIVEAIEDGVKGAKCIFDHVVSSLSQEEIELDDLTAFEVWDVVKLNGAKYEYG